MTKRIFSSLVAASLLVSTLPALASASAATPNAAAPGGAHVIRGSFGSPTGSPRVAAGKILARVDQELGVDASLFRFDEVGHSLAGLHVRGRQYRGKVPVERSSAAVHFVAGEAVQVEAHSVDLKGRPAADPISSDDAVDAVLSALDVDRLLVPPRPERLLVRSAGRLVDVWRVPVLSAAPALNATVDVAVADASILRITDESLYVDGSAKVFNPNPIVALKDSSVRQPGESQGLDTDLDSPELTKARVRLPLKDLDEAELQAGRLSGPWVNIYSEGYNSLDGNFNFTRSDARFEGTMAYAHIDRVQRYFRSLGFKRKKSVNGESQDVIAAPVPGYDNSFYQPGNDVMFLGSGGVDDGEDAEVIIHEYGHAVQDAQVDNWGQTDDGGAMGEGFGDFLAGAYYARRASRGFQDACVADWDVTSYSNANPPCLRRLDENKHYPEDLSPDREVHDDGEIWSAFLWDLRRSLGKTPTSRSDRSIKLVLTSHEFLTPRAKFGDAVGALRTAAKALGHRRWARKVKRAANKRGLPLRP